MGAKKLTAMDFTRAYLRKKRKATYAEIRDAGKKKRLTIYPITYGRAQSLEGIVKTAKYWLLDGEALVPSERVTTGTRRPSRARQPDKRRRQTFGRE